MCCTWANFVVQLKSILNALLSEWPGSFFSSFTLLRILHTCILADLQIRSFSSSSKQAVPNPGKQFVGKAWWSHTPSEGFRFTSSLTCCFRWWSGCLPNWLFNYTVHIKAVGKLLMDFDAWAECRMRSIRHHHPSKPLLIDYRSLLFRDEPLWWGTNKQLPEEINTVYGISSGTVL